MDWEWDCDCKEMRERTDDRMQILAVNPEREARHAALASPLFPTERNLTD